MSKYGDSLTASELVVKTVADEMDVAPTKLDPLYDVIDPDCLNRIFREATPTAGHDSIQVQFTYHSCEVIVTGGEVDVTPLDDGPSQSRTIGFASDSNRASESPD